MMGLVGNGYLLKRKANTMTFIVSLIMHSAKFIFCCKDINTFYEYISVDIQSGINSVCLLLLFQKPVNRRHLSNKISSEICIKLLCILSHEHESYKLAQVFSVFSYLFLTSRKTTRSQKAQYSNDYERYLAVLMLKIMSQTQNIDNNNIRIGKPRTGDVNAINIQFNCYLKISDLFHAIGMSRYIAK